VEPTEKLRLEDALAALKTCFRNLKTVHASDELKPKSHLTSINTQTSLFQTNRYKNRSWREYYLLFGNT